MEFSLSPLPVLWLFSQFLNINQSTHTQQPAESTVLAPREVKTLAQRPPARSQRGPQAPRTFSHSDRQVHSAPALPGWLLLRSVSLGHTTWGRGVGGSPGQVDFLNLRLRVRRDAVLPRKATAQHCQVVGTSVLGACISQPLWRATRGQAVRQASGPFKLAKPSSLAEAHSLVGGQPGSEGARGFLRSNCRKGSCECPKEGIWAGSAEASPVRPEQMQVFQAGMAYPQH